MANNSTNPNQSQRVMVPSEKKKAEDHSPSNKGAQKKEGRMISRQTHLLKLASHNFLKPLPQVLLERRATSHFKPEPVPDEILEAILEMAGQAPSGYNLQPWRFIVVRDAENRRRLREAAMNQAKVSEAPVVVIAIGMKDETLSGVEEVLREGAQRGAGKPEDVSKTTQDVKKFLSTFPMHVWVNRHVMIAFTTMMLAAETLGYDTAPMEGFDPKAVKRQFNIPDDAEVIALLAIGRMAEPDKPYPGRFPLARIVFSERYGSAWPGASVEKPASSTLSHNNHETEQDR